MNNRDSDNNTWWINQSRQSQEREKQYQEAKRRAEIARKNGALGGRKPVNKEARIHHLNILLTNDEYKAIKENSKKTNLTMSEYLRRVGQNVHIFSETELAILKQLYEYRNHFIRIANMYHNREDLATISILVRDTAETIKNYIYDLQSKGNKRLY
jgi:hypothetical protein